MMERSVSFFDYASLALLNFGISFSFSFSFSFSVFFLRAAANERHVHGKGPLPSFVPFQRGYFISISTAM